MKQTCINWVKFSATTGLGVIHSGYLQQERSLMDCYFPQCRNGRGDSPYLEGGSLYALGLIYVNHNEGIKKPLRDSLSSTNVEVLVLVDCIIVITKLFFLVIGLTFAYLFGTNYSTLKTLGTTDKDIYNDIKNVQYTDSVVTAEAASIVMGLLMNGITI